MPGINPIIEEKIKNSEYRDEIKSLLLRLLEYEDFREGSNEKTYAPQYDRIISAYIKKQDG